MEYQDFEIELTTLADGTHQVNVLNTPAGQTRQQLAFGLSDAALREKLTEIEATLRAEKDLTAEEKRAQIKAIKAFGGGLFDTLIHDNLKALYDQSRYIVKQRGQGLRLKLRIQSSLLTAVPWELLYDPRFDEFLCTSRQVSVARYVALPRPAQLMATKPPLNVLGVVAAPSNLPPLDVAFEKQQVEAALRPLVEQGLANLTWLEAANRRMLLRAMNHGPWHVFHYVGHSGFDEEDDEGYLSLLGDDGREERLSAGKLAMLLADHGTLRLVVLNSCMGARIGQDIYAGLATTLVRRGIPAVIGMQYDISDEAALTLAQTFYETLAENLPIETALAEARKAISLGVEESAEWGTPVFYTHAPDSVLFDVARQMIGDAAEAPAVAEGEEASVTDQAYLTQIYELLMARFNESELQTLCFYLGIDYESLNGTAKPGKIRELVQYCDRAGRLGDLRERVKGERPLAQWPEPTRSDVTRGVREVVVDVDVWVKALEQSPTIQNPVTRQAVVSELPASIRNSLNSHLPTLTTQLRDLVRTCQNYQNGLPDLVKAIRTLEGDSFTVYHLESLLSTLTISIQQQTGTIVELPKPPRERHIVFGRQDEKAAIGSWLAQEGTETTYRCVTIAGMPGVGKSAMAYAMEEQAKAMGFTPHWVSLENSRENLWNVLGRGLGVELPYEETVHTQLEAKRILLVLDGADDFVGTEDLKQFLYSLNASFPSKVIVTARKFVGLPIELKISLGPLPLEPAAEWFLRCWEKDRSELENEELAQLELICGPNLLDGHPLSISIVGSIAGERKREGDDDISRLYRELRDLIEFAQSTLPNLLEEDRYVPKYSAWAAIGMAFDRLSAEAQELMIRLSFLTNEFDRELLEAVSAVKKAPLLHQEKLRRELFDLALLTYDETHKVFKVHSIVRAFARRRAMQREGRDLAQAAVGLCMVEHENPLYHFSGVMNLFEASAWQDLIQAFRNQYGPVANSPLFDTSGYSEEMLRTLAAYCITWALSERGLVEQAIAQGENGLEQLGQMTESPWAKVLRMRFLMVLANNVLGKGDEALANQLLEQAIDAESAISQEPLWEIGQLRLAQGRLYRQQGRYGEAQSVLQQAQDIFAELGDDNQRLIALSGLSTVAYDLGDFVESIRLSEEIIPILDSLPDTQHSASARTVERANLVEALAQKGDFEKALQWANEGLLLAGKWNLIWEHTALLINAAKAQIKLDKLAEAEVGLTKSRQLTLEAGYESFKCELHYCTAEFYMSLGQLADAMREIDEALRVEDDIPQYTAEAKRIKGTILLAQGKNEEALETLNDLKSYAAQYNLAYHTARAALETARVYRQMNRLTDVSSALNEAIPYFQANEMTYYLQEAENLLQQ